MDRSTLLAAGLGVALVAAVTPLLGGLHYNFDEGLYILQARAILAGELPYRDFFYHQTPLYPFTLALASWPAPGFVAPRFLSLLAFACCGLALHRIARRMLDPAPALLATAIFYTAPLQYWSFLALPNALMVLCSTAGIALVWLESARGRVALGAVLLAVSILYKPLSLAAGAALGLAVLAAPAQRGKVVVVLAAGAATGLGAWLLFHLASGGLFTEVLALQSGRYASRGGFEVMRAFPPFGELVERQGIETALQWNVHEHVRAFWLDRALYGNHWLALLGSVGAALLWSPWGVAWRDHRLLLTLWLLLPIGFSLFVWEPVWDHYFVQYLPPLALLAALPLARLWDAAGGRWPARGVALAATAGLAALGPWYWTLRTVDYSPLQSEQTRGETWLTFDPFLNVVSGTEPACGVIDWINVYGDASLTGRSGSDVWSPFHVASEELVACLAADPGIRVGLGFWAAFYCDETARRYIDTLPPERFVPLGDF